MIEIKQSKDQIFLLIYSAYKLSLKIEKNVYHKLAFMNIEHYVMNIEKVIFKVILSLKLRILILDCCQTPILEETTPQHATKEGGKELHKFIKTLNNFVENLVVNNDKDYNIKKGDYYSDKHSDNDDIISNEIEKFHVNTLATPQDFYENGTSKRYRRENDGGVLGLNNGAWNDWDPVRKSKSSSFLVDVEGGGGENGNFF